MRRLARQAGAALKNIFEVVWNYLGSLAAVSLFAAVLGLGIFHAVVQDSAPTYYCYAGVHNPAGAFPPSGVAFMGEKVTPGVPHVRLEYDTGQRLRSMKSVDKDGRICALPASKVAEQRLVYDAQGRLVRKENRDALGRPAEDAQGVAVREFERDAAGRVVGTRFRNAAGVLTVPRFPGYAECRVQFDEVGRPLKVEYLDAEGARIRNAVGEECVVYNYGKDDAVTRSNFVNGELADNYAGIACEEQVSCDTGMCLRWKNAAGKPVLNPAVGAAVLLQEKRDKNIVRRCFLLPSGDKDSRSLPYCSEHLVRLDNHARPEWEFFGGVDGLPVNHPALGYAERLCRYAPDGKLDREYFWNADGSAAAVAERRYAETPSGRFQLTLHSDGSTTVQPH